MWTWKYTHICKNNIPTAALAMTYFLMIILAILVHQCSMLNSVDVQSHLVITKTQELIYLGHRYQALISFACVAEYISKLFFVAVLYRTYPAPREKKCKLKKKTSNKKTPKRQVKKTSVANEMKVLEFLKLFFPLWKKCAKIFLGGKKFQENLGAKFCPPLATFVINFAFVFSVKEGAVGSPFPSSPPRSSCPSPAWAVSQCCAHAIAPLMSWGCPGWLGFVRSHLSLSGLGGVSFALLQLLLHFICTEPGNSLASLHADNHGQPKRAGYFCPAYLSHPHGFC